MVFVNTLYTHTLSLCVCLLSIHPMFGCGNRRQRRERDRYVYLFIVHCFFQVYLVDEIRCSISLRVCVLSEWVSRFVCKTHSPAEIGFSVHVFGFVAPFYSFAIVYLSAGSQQQSSYEFNLNPLMHHFHWVLTTLLLFRLSFLRSSELCFFFLVYTLDLELSQGTSSDFTFTLLSWAVFLFVRLPLAQWAEPKPLTERKTFVQKSNQKDSF